MSYNVDTINGQGSSAKLKTVREANEAAAAGELSTNEVLQAAGLAALHGIQQPELDLPPVSRSSE